MKNTLPLIIAVLLGLAAVFAVNRTLARNGKSGDRSVDVVVANRDLSPGSKLESGVCSSVSIPKEAYLEGRHILAEQIPRIETLSVSRRIEEGHHILWDDLDTEEAGQQAGNGEFVVAVKFQNSPLLSHLHDGAEIAIAAMQTFEEKERVGMREDEVVVRHVQRLSVLFPCVKVLQVSRDTILVSAPPEEALRLVTASQFLPLYPLLRRTGDRQNLGVGVGGSVSPMDLDLENLKKLTSGQ